MVKAYSLGHILVVDDEEFIRGFLEMGLESFGYTVSLAANGKVALDLISANPQGFDLVVMDLNIPVMSGKDALAAIHPLAPTLPIIVASGYVTDSDRAELKHLGAKAILCKPFRISELKDKVSQILAAPHASEQHTDPRG
jgi:DNA-binding response OmpR family regulator